MSAYAGHLASLQKKTQVTASEDIVSDNGVLIAKSGTEINEGTCQKILKFKLLKPIEDSVLIENQLEPKSIFEQITHLIESDPYLNTLDSKLGNTNVLRTCCIRVKKYPLLLQKLTVLKMELTDVFKQSLLSGYFAYLCGLLEKRSQEKIEEGFLAGLTHDIGYLHIDRYIFSKKETLTAEEWKKIQSHPVIGYEILKRIQGIPKAVAIAVLEHHENINGSGYPRAKAGEELSDLGQLINLLDNVIVIYNKRFKPLKRSLHDVMPIIQINMHSYLPQVVSIVFRLLKQVPLSNIEESDCNVLQPLIEHVQEKQHYIKTLINSIKVTNQELGSTHNEKPLTALQDIGTNIMNIVNSAGLDGENLDWLKQPDNEDRQALYIEVEDIRLMQGEIIYQLQVYQKSANVFIDKNPDHALIKTLEATINIFADTVRPSAPKALEDYWTQLKPKKR